MHSVQVHEVINQIISLFYLTSIWHRGDKPTVIEQRLKLFYCIYFIIFFVTLVVGGITSKKEDDVIFLAELSIAVGVLNFKLWILIWKQNRIFDLLHRICSFSITYDEDLDFFNGKLRGFIKFVIVFCIMVLLCTCEVGIIPLMGSNKTLPIDIAFPMDYRNSVIAFWIAHLFIFMGDILSFAVIFYSITTWYLLFSCSLRVTNELESFLSDTFLTQFATSGLCICGSIYCLAFDVGDNLLERSMHLLVLNYFIADLFMITYFGNEIMFSSNRVSYSLFQSDWAEQSQATKKLLIIFGEFLKRPHKLMIGKLYPLNLETFTKILRSAYSMFNILKSFQK